MLILLLILDFALVGENDSAVQQLKEWSQKSDDEELKWCYDYYLKNNLSTISQQYKKTKRALIYCVWVNISSVHN